jgi:hypothetical protein
MRVYRAPGPDWREAEQDKRGAGGFWHRDGHHGGLLAAGLKLGHAGAAGLHELERADLPGGSAYQNADSDTDQFLVVTGPHAFVRSADAGDFTDRGRPDAVADADCVRLVAVGRPSVVGSV